MTTTEQPISRLRVPEEQELPDSLQRFFRATREAEGHLPNWLAAFSLGGEQFARLKDYVLPLLSGGSGHLTLREREIIATVVSVRNGCSYCHTLHVHSLAEVLGDRWLAERTGIDHREVAELSERERALADLADTVTTSPREVREREVDELRELGLDDEAVFEAVQVTAVINATNRITLALGVLPDREIFPS